MEPTKRCPACAEEIQSAAVKCKHCGTTIGDAAAKPPPAKRGTWKWLILGLGALIILPAMFGGAKHPAATADACQGKPQVVGADDLLRQFEGNEVAATGQWKGVCARVQGVVDSVDDGAMGATLRLRGDLMKGVRCSGIPREQLESLRKGETVWMTGVVKGQYWDVQLHDCKLSP